jgi:hypothetical protein
MSVATEDHDCLARTAIDQKSPSDAKYDMKYYDLSSGRR